MGYSLWDIHPPTPCAQLFKDPFSSNFKVSLGWLNRSQMPTLPDNLYLVLHSSNIL